MAEEMSHEQASRCFLGCSRLSGRTVSLPGAGRWRVAATGLLVRGHGGGGGAVRAELCCAAEAAADRCPADAGGAEAAADRCPADAGGAGAGGGRFAAVTASPCSQGQGTAPRASWALPP